MADSEPSIQSLYGSADLVERVLRAIEESGHDVAKPTPETFYPVDQLHGGGLVSTRAQAELVGIAPGMRVLDAGCGIGGASRYLAHEHDCRVDAIDLTPEYVEAARRLSALCGLGERIAFRQGSVTALPYPDRSFDMVWSQNVAMNVEDKPRMFAEAYRVLVPGGRYTMSLGAAGPAGEPYFPLSWAREPHDSFLETEERILGWLEAAGFEGIENHPDAGAFGATTPPGALGASIAMGEDMPERQANVRRSKAEGRLKQMVVVALRGA